MKIIIIIMKIQFIFINNRTIKNLNIIYNKLKYYMKIYIIIKIFYIIFIFNYYYFFNLYILIFNKFNCNFIFILKT